MSYQIAIIGGGPGGYVAAIRAAQLGARVVVIEQDALGGTCLNRGCIPTKALLAGAALVKGIQGAAAFGIDVKDYRVDYARLAARKDAVVKQLTQGIAYLFKKNKVDHIKGRGFLKGPGRVEVATAEGTVENIEAENIILATGSEPALIAALGYNGSSVVTSTEALAWTEVPAELLIIGGGVIGCEFATLFATLGSKVTIVEMMPTILPMIDSEISKRFSMILKKAGVEIKTKAQIISVREEDGRVKATLADGQTVTADKVLISIGRQFNTRDLGLEEAGIALGPKGEIIVDEYMRTSVPGIYAIGDVTNKIQLAHVASAQGLAAVETIMGRPTKVNYDAVPSCIYTLPEIAGVGLTREAAEERGLKVKVGKFPFLASGKALCSGETEGMVKIIAEAESDRVVGVFIMGPHATELIAEGTLAVNRGITATELAATIHAHPTLAEAVMEAAEAVHGMSIHS
ncbi:Dihydrolipoamide dehydrogenase [Moorella glycerini]|uniref:Dihydrolipoyl dehydrogenase n=1 Tax=Neomoorella stamsii TaxID=1266720 RepID=A0A9X7P4Z9_9FIRM|nr:MULTISPECIES: dihydrolipoyl dehydrogenase [Moorella]PRR69646.1 Dihydrolipoyl dehydrogenase [Moorella stamsii]CEP67830.1 Dihydrolipoamide dehydrogenase [Moorella glycerini]